jgi:uncharacterized protein (TIGR03083 family)
VSDYETAYRDLRERVTGLLADRADAELEQVAPATPAWRVRDVVSHMAGVCDDITNGNMDGVATDAWTQAQVDKRTEWQTAQILDDWTKHAAAIEPQMNAFGQPIGQMVFDAWTHEQDMRGALGLVGGRDSSAMEISWEWFVQTNRAATPTEARALVLVTEVGEVRLGGGEPVAIVRTSRFEFLRAVTGRRSRAQLQDFDVEGAALDGLIFGGDLFTPADRDIVE